MPDRPQRPLSRRRFLTTAGIAAGTLLGAPALGGYAQTSAASAPASQASTLLTRSVAQLLGQPTLAVVLPRDASERASRSFLIGMQLDTGQAERPAPPLLVERVGEGQHLDGVLEQLHTARAADMLVVVGDAGQVDTRLLARASDAAPLVLAGLGANMPRRNDQHAGLFYSTLHYWQASYALGAWAASNIGRRAVIASSFYDSGYDTPYAFQLGFESAGGSLSDLFVSQRPGATSDHLDTLLDRAAATRPDVVFAAYSGAQATDFARAYAQSTLARQAPLLGTGLFATPQALDALSGTTAFYTAAPWAEQPAAAHSQRFDAAFRAAAGYAPDAPALLGYQTSQLLGTAFADGGADPQQLHVALARASFSSPRGASTMSAHERALAAPINLSRLQPGGGRTTLQTIEALVLPAMVDPALAPLRDSLKTGWINAFHFA